MATPSWLRPWLQNWATIEETAAEPWLRPWKLPVSVTDAADQACRWANEQSLWKVSDPGNRGDDRATIQLHLTRRTTIFRFVDDIHLRIEPVSPLGCEVFGESRSRVGKGDLGQNRRNLRELAFGAGFVASQ